MLENITPGQLDWIGKVDCRIYHQNFPLLIPDLTLFKGQKLSATLLILSSKIVSEYDQEIPQSQTTDNPVARKEEPLNHPETPGRQIKQSNQLSLPHQDDCNTRMDIN